MKLSDIKNEIDKDSKIDITQLDLESINIPILHSKYYNMYIEEMKILKGMEIEFNKLKKERIEYYLGKADDSVYIEEPLDKKILKGDIDIYLSSDEKLCSLENKKSLQKMKTETLEVMIKQINQRSFNIRNAIEFLKYKNGIV